MKMDDIIHNLGENIYMCCVLANKKNTPCKIVPSTNHSKTLHYWILALLQMAEKDVASQMRKLVTKHNCCADKSKLPCFESLLTTDHTVVTIDNLRRFDLFPKEKDGRNMKHYAPQLYNAYSVVWKEGKSAKANKKPP